MAAITKRENKTGVSYQIQVKVKDQSTGKLVIKSMTWKPDDGMTLKQIEREVVLVASKYESEIREMVTGAISGIEEMNITLNQYCENWLDRRQGELALNSYVNYKDTLNLIKEHIGGVQLKKLTPFSIQKFYDTLDNMKKTTSYAIAKPSFRKTIDKKGITREQLAKLVKTTHTTINRAQNGENISVKSAEKLAKELGKDVDKLFKIVIKEEPYAYETMHKHKRGLRAILATAKKQRLIPDNYASSDYIITTKRPETEIKFMDDYESKEFYKELMQMKDIRIKTALLTLLMTGLRRGELCGLDWTNINFEEETLTIKQSYISVRGYGKVLKSPKTNSSKRTMAISKVLVKQLKEYKEWQDEQKAFLEDLWNDSGAMLTGQNGDRLCPQSINTWLDNVLKTANLDHYTPHSIRHSNITLQLIAGVPINIVSGRAGHARTSTTSDIYSHFVKSVDKVAAEKLNTMFEGI